MSGFEIRSLRQLQMRVESARAAIMGLRELMREGKATGRRAWRWADIIDIALSDADNQLSFDLDFLETRREREEKEERVGPVAGRRGGLRIALVESKKREHEPLFCPMLYCDACGKLIEGSGNLLYEVGTERDEASYGRPLTGDVFFFHKGCDRPWERERGGHFLWDELQMLPARLAANLSLKVRPYGDHRGWVIEKKSKP